MLILNGEWFFPGGNVWQCLKHCDQHSYTGAIGSQCLRAGFASNPTLHKTAICTKLGVLVCCLNSILVEKPLSASAFKKDVPSILWRCPNLSSMEG